MLCVTHLLSCEAPWGRCAQRGTAATAETCTPSRFGRTPRSAHSQKAQHARSDLKHNTLMRDTRRSCSKRVFSHPTRAESTRSHKSHASLSSLMMSGSPPHKLLHLVTCVTLGFHVEMVSLRNVPLRDVPLQRLCTKTIVAVKLAPPCPSPRGTCSTWPSSTASTAR